MTARLRPLSSGGAQRRERRSRRDVEVAEVLLPEAWNLGSEVQCNGKPS